MSESEREAVHRIAPGDHYVSGRQSALWQDLATAWSPADEAEVRAAYALVFRGVAAEYSGQRVHLIGLGAGGGDKELALAKELCAAGVRVRFTAVDVSAALVSAARLRLEEVASPEGNGLVADVLHDDDLPKRLAEMDVAGEETIFTAFGLSPNALPGKFFRSLAALSGGRAVLASANLWPPGDEDSARGEVLAQYDNAPTRRWLAQVFVEWGLAGALPESALEFRVGEIEGVKAIRVLVRWPGDVRGDLVPPEAARWAADEVVEVFFSLRYSPDNFGRLAATAGLQEMNSVVSECGREGVFVLRDGGATLPSSV